MGYRCCLKLCLAVLVCFFAVGSGNAQSATGSITGTVTDPKGLVAADATVLVKNAETDAEVSLTTNSAGLYAASYLQPGRYDVTISKTGFNSVTFQKITVHVGDTVTLDAQRPETSTTCRISRPSISAWVAD